MAISEMTTDELRAFLRQEIRDIVREAVREALNEQPNASRPPLRSPLEIPVVDIPWHPGLEAMSREDYYGDEGR